MRLLFFDIECADGANMCSFGYVLTDENFNIIEKRDILINPECRFRLSGRNDPGIELNYSEAEFYRSPKFPHYYPLIKELITYPDQFIIGHAIGNDTKYIVTQCKRYNLPFLNYSFVDSQVLYKHSSLSAKPASLENILNELGCESMRAHKSDDDAAMTVTVMKKLCEKTGYRVGELIESCPKAQGEVNGEEIKLGGRTIGAEPNYNKYLGFLFNVRRRRMLRNETIKDKSFCFCIDYEKKYPDKMASLVQHLTDCGGKCHRKPLKADYFVRGEQECDRLLMLYEKKAAGEDIADIITMEELCRMAKTDFLSLEPYIFPEAPAVKDRVRKEHSHGAGNAMQRAFMAGGYVEKDEKNL